MKELRPLNNYCIVKLFEPKDKLASGIFLPEKSLERPRWARVVSVGEGLGDSSGNRHKPDIKEGDVVFMFQHAPVQITTEDEEWGVLHAVSEGDIWCSIQVVGEKVSLLPMGNFLHIEPIQEDRLEVSPGGIFLPETKKKRPDRARVVAVGPGQRCENGTFLTPMIFPGQIVHIDRNAVLTVDFKDLGEDEGKQSLIAYGDCYAVIEESLPLAELMEAR